MLFTACDEDTGSVGSMLTNDVDQLEVSSSVFKVSSRSVGAESILARSSLGYLGRIKDPETGAYITTDFMTQFNCLENYKLTPIDSIASYSSDGGICADSCEIRLFYENFYGDSLSLMRLTAYEMGTPMTDAIHYYSDFDPITSGYVREDGIKKDMNVLAQGGLIGIVTETGGHWATVRAIIDDTSAISAMASITSETCIVEGSLTSMNNGKIRFQGLRDPDGQVVEGASIVTSNISENYVSGLLIGYVSDISLDSNNLTKSGTLIPAADFRALREVLIITDLKQTRENED